MRLVILFLLSSFCFADFVNDNAAILTLEQRSHLERKLKAVDSRGGPQIAVAILNDLENKALEEISFEIFKSWGIGHKDKNDGVLLLIALKERKTRIELGYGSELFINDAMAGRIIRENITPFFKEGQYYEGIQSGLDAILARFNYKPPEPWFFFFCIGLTPFLVILLLNLLFPTDKNTNYVKKRRTLFPLTIMGC